MPIFSNCPYLKNKLNGNNKSSYLCCRKKKSYMQLKLQDNWEPSGDTSYNKSSRTFNLGLPKPEENMQEVSWEFSSQLE